MQTPDDSLMERVMEVINENISDSDLSVDMIAQKVGISRVHLHRKMKELTNQTPHSFIRNIRLQQAAKLLKDGKQSITDVMYACGFSNSGQFQHHVQELSMVVLLENTCMNAYEGVKMIYSRKKNYVTKNEALLKHRKKSWLHFTTKDCK